MTFKPTRRGIRVVAMTLFCVAVFVLAMCVMQDREHVAHEAISGSVGAIMTAAYLRPGVVLRILG